MTTTQPNSCQTMSWDSKVCPVNENCITEMGLRSLGFNDNEGNKCYAFPFAPSKDEMRHIDKHFDWCSRGVLPTIPWVWVWTHYDTESDTIEMQFSFQNVEFHKDNTKMPISYESVKKAASVFTEGILSIIRFIHLMKQ